MDERTRPTEVSNSSPVSEQALLVDDDHPHFVGAMGLENWFEGETTYGKEAIGRFLCVPGTSYPRISVLATMVDVVAGSRPTGFINPTVDLHVNVMALVPVSTVLLR